jgi:hypothetical protein
MGWMMARMLSQLPLPLLPGGAAEIARGVGCQLTCALPGHSE